MSGTALGLYNSLSKTQAMAARLDRRLRGAETAPDTIGYRKV